MSIWIKANKLVAQHLNVGRSRKKLLDGCVLLWFRDMEAFGPLTSLNESISRIGGLRLTGSEAAEERDGRVLRPLPLATDPRFFIEYEANRNGMAAAPAPAAAVDETADETADDAPAPADGGEPLDTTSNTDEE